MSQQPDKANGHAADRAALRRRVKHLYDALNNERWNDCYEIIDRRLRQAGRIAADNHAASLKEFKVCYDGVRIWYMRISLHMEVPRSKQNDRPFAYVYIVWQDARNEFHMFRERWIKDAGRWYTRVVGLVPNQSEPAAL